MYDIDGMEDNVDIDADTIFALAVLLLALAKVIAELRKWRMSRDNLDETGATIWVRRGGRVK